jgi:hypothetical protein
VPTLYSEARGTSLGSDQEPELLTDVKTSSMNLSPERVLPVLGRNPVKAITVSSAETTGLYSVYCVLMLLPMLVTLIFRGTDMKATALLTVFSASSAWVTAFLSAFTAFR